MLSDFYKKNILKSIHYDKEIQLNFPPKISSFNNIFYKKENENDSQKKYSLVYSSISHSIYIDVYKSLLGNKISNSELLDHFNYRLSFYKKEDVFAEMASSIQDSPDFVEINKKINKYGSSQIEFLHALYKYDVNGASRFMGVYFAAIKGKFIQIESVFAENDLVKYEQNTNAFIEEFILRTNYQSYLKNLSFNEKYLYKVCDPALEECLEIGKVESQDNYKEYKIILMHIPKVIGSFYYPFRLFFYYKDSTFPILALNMENSISGTLAFGAHTISSHILGEMKEESDFTFENFMKWADSVTDGLLIEVETEMNK